MSVNEHVSIFAGLPVVEFDPADPPRSDPGAFAWRLSAGDDNDADEFRNRARALMAAPWADQVKAIIVGEWGESFDTTIPLALFVDAADRLTGLTAIFLGEMISEENEISWIQSDDVTPLLEAYPGLGILQARGGEGLAIAPGRYPGLRTLIFEAGGLSAAIVRAVGECDLPNLTHLELWLGTDNYGGDANAEDLAGILTGGRLPALTYLGLRNAEIADAVAGVLAGAPVVARLEVLDLSLGMLSDTGAAALLSGQPLTHLRRLDLSHAFLSDAMMDQLRDELVPAGVDLDLSDAKGDEDADERYIAVSE
jgi:hypothetical protein